MLFYQDALGFGDSHVPQKVGHIHWTHTPLLEVGVDVELGLGVERAFRRKAVRTAISLFSLQHFAKKLVHYF